MFKLFVSNCKEPYKLGEYIILDEKWWPYRDRCFFKQYIPNYPSKYGFKIYALVDTRTFFTRKLKIHAGRLSKSPNNIENSTDKVLKRLVKLILDMERNLTVDKWYTNFDLSELLQNKSTSVGTIRKNKELPKELVMH